MPFDIGDVLKAGPLAVTSVVCLLLGYIVYRLVDRSVLQKRSGNGGAVDRSTEVPHPRAAVMSSKEVFVAWSDYVRHSRVEMPEHWRLAVDERAAHKSNNAVAPLTLVLGRLEATVSEERREREVYQREHERDAAQLRDEVSRLKGFAEANNELMNKVLGAIDAMNGRIDNVLVHLVKE